MIIKPSYIVEWMLDNKNKMFLKIPYFLARGSARLGSRNSQLGSARALLARARLGSRKKFMAGSQLGSARTTPGSARLELEIFWLDPPLMQ